MKLEEQQKVIEYLTISFGNEDYAKKFIEFMEDKSLLAFKSYIDTSPDFLQRLQVVLQNIQNDRLNGIPVFTWDIDLKSYIIEQ